MTDREILIELLAIKLYEHDTQSRLWPGGHGNTTQAWNFIADEDRQIYRDVIAGASTPRSMYGDDGEGLA